METAKRESVADQLLKGEEETLKLYLEAYALLVRISPEALRCRPLISTFYWCPVCKRVRHADTYSTKLQSNLYSYFRLELLLKSLKNVRDKVCSKCKSPAFPFGYVAGFLSHILSSEKGAVIIEESKGNSPLKEALVRGYSTVLGRSLIAVREVYRDVNGKVTDVGDPKAMSWILPELLPRLPDALLYV